MNTEKMKSRDGCQASEDPGRMDASPEEECSHGIKEAED